MISEFALSGIGLDFVADYGSDRIPSNKLMKGVVVMSHSSLGRSPRVLVTGAVAALLASAFCIGPRVLVTLGVSNQS